ncbi:GGDEF domain-containing protein [Salinicola avicenniae]|uniref:GGDEF domain-containing protein n=1 Tax=Salinicola avicenniae TaxID=2916836 RepID=UPI002072DB69|nr:MULTISPECIES: sensor domain-containing diguanylate cyclase [unclassified Salinicola]
MVVSRDAESRPDTRPPLTLAGLDALDIAALVYRLDHGVPLLVSANDTACQRLQLGNRFPLAEPWQWLDAQRQPAAGRDHPALLAQPGAAGTSRQWRCYHLRQHQQPLRALQLKVSPLAPTAPGEAPRVLVAIGDILDVDAARPKLPQAGPHLHQLLGSLPMGVCVIDVDGYLRLINRAFCDFFGYAERELLNAHFRKLLPPRHREAAESRHATNFPDAETQRRSVEVQLKDGTERTVIIEDTISQDENGQPQRIAFLVDITERMNFERRLTEKNRRLEHLATRDDLTGLHNRRFGSGLLEQALQRSQRYGERVAVAMIDLDHFKSINDRYGHPVGDAVLTEFSRHVESALRTSDTLVRWGGEEFLLILPGVDRFAAQATVKRVLRELETVPMSPARLRISFSAGVGEHRQQSAERLLEEIDQALYQAKAVGRSCVAIAPVASVVPSRRSAFSPSGSER